MGDWTRNQSILFFRFQGTKLHKHFLDFQYFPCFVEGSQGIADACLSYDIIRSPPQEHSWMYLWLSGLNEGYIYNPITNTISQTAMYFDLPSFPLDEYLGK